MALVPSATRQWTPAATATYACASRRYAFVALEYIDCVVLQLWKNEASPENDCPSSAMPGLVELGGHTERVHLASFHESSACDTLCTVSTDRVLLWRLVPAPYDKIEIQKLPLTESPRAEVSAIAFDASGTLLAVALGKQVDVLQAQTGGIFITLEGHLAKITECLFHPCHPHWLVTASEDRTYKIWDLSEQKLLFQSAVLSAYAILRLAVHPVSGDIACAFGDGVVRVFDATKFGNELASANLAQYLDRREKKQHVAQQVEKVLEATQNVVSSLPPWARSQRAYESAQARALAKANESLDPTPVVLPGMEHLMEPMHETTCTILGLAYMASSATATPPETLLDVQPIVEAAHTLLVATVNYLVGINAFSYDTRVIRAFQDEVEVSMGIAKHASLRPEPGRCDVWVLDAFMPRVTALSVAAAHHALSQSSLATTHGLSMHPQTSPPEGSVLVQLLTPLAKRTKSPLDQPITYRTSIPSSGYGAEKKPKSLSLRFKGLGKAKLPAKVSTKSATLLTEYPLDAPVPSALVSSHVKLHEMAINHIEFSNDGRRLATAANDRLGQVLALHKPQSHLFVGHDKAVRAIHWSHSNKLLVTASADATACVWVNGSDVASLTLPLPSASKRAKKPVKADVADAVFYYMDKFVAGKRADVAQLENLSTAKAVASYRFEAVQSLTGLAAHNAFLSHLLVATGSDKSIRIVDVAVGKTARTIHGAHSRPAHSVVLPRASSYVKHAPNVYDLLLTSAPDSTVHLWDIRADNCIMRFGEHLNRVHALGAAFSPCMRYVATGSEDKVAYVYDIRMGRSLAKLHGHTDVVTSVAFHPVRPQIATAALDGSVEVILRDMALEYAHELAHLAAEAAQHRGSDRVEAKDVVFGARTHRPPSHTKQKSAMASSVAKD
ncbi:hypothetical protein SPRG_04636 [Saprolegnia parasitica CBS 223.65]|uniref:Uncharacterized protein n=1 Tax=Saprolegnia parasitica (strain CBS 223.65) TaxID=695850 RepID=A0A067CND9_SAPPC|nr:hypothetical protein SPRG_04636 [Saprolegnia parasitica CBS 223.65]KDO30735.1 hypothetical protein SPRG_04636 [Saprolegnia parasitica CBS 223.65]|eukprot:XP_012198435.1 hypothetical protein SPRG_04636 [Saprolegnia parasitica CBS 223.65]